MGIHQLPQIANYWSGEWVLGVPAFASIMTRDRFLVILRYLHFNDNDAMPPRGDPAFDKLYKVRPLIKALKQHFQQEYSPHFMQAVDEAKITYKGRTSLKQYMPMKPIKRGLKVWVRADSISSYFCDFNIYEGKMMHKVISSGTKSSRPFAKFCLKRTTRFSLTISSPVLPSWKIYWRSKHLPVEL